MRYLVIVILMVLTSCSPKTVLNEYLTEVTPNDVPIPYKPNLTPKGILIHSGRFSPDLNEYYFTLSDKEFRQFDVKVIRKEGGKWSKTENAFFNTKYNEHGTSFSPDGRYVYFSSTRPIENMPDTWHLWRSEKLKEKWSEPKFVNIPNLREKLVSHPSVTKDGTLYFHAGEIDYSKLDIYYSKQIDGEYKDAIKLADEVNFGKQQFTPYIAPNETYILFGSDDKLFISYRGEDGGWSKAKALNEKINVHNKGNP